MSDQTKPEAVVVEAAVVDATVAAPEVATPKAAKPKAATPKRARKPKAAKPDADAKPAEETQDDVNPWDEPVQVTMARALVVLAAEAVLVMVDYPPDLNSEAANASYDGAALTALNDLCDAIGVDVAAGPHSDLAAMRDAAFGGVPRQPRRKSSRKK